MRYYILLLVFTLAWLQPVSGQSSIANAYDIGTLSNSSVFSDTKNTNLFSNNYNAENSNNGQKGNDVFYKFTLTKWMIVFITQCGSEVSDTFLNLLDASGTEIMSIDGDGIGDGSCPNNDQGCLRETLPPGTYYIVSEGYTENGNISTSVSATFAPTPLGDTFDNPIDIGTKSVGSSYSDNQDAFNFNNDYGQPSPDIYYKFTIAKNLEVSIWNSSSSEYTYLLNSSGVEIASINSIFRQTLTPGTYYIVREGAGNLFTYVTFATPIGDVFSNPISIGTLNGDAIYTDTQNTNNFSNDFGQPSNDVYYKFAITKNMTISITTCGSILSNPYLHLLNSAGTEIAANNNYVGSGACTSGAQAYIRQTLATGTYYIVLEGSGSSNGIITTSLQAIPSFAGTQSSSGLNYISTTIPTVETTDASILTTDQSLQTNQYFDGLGRPSQTVQRGITTTGADLVSGIEYDAYGREIRRWLPGAVSGNNGAYVSDFASLSGSSNNDFSPYTTTLYEPSPLNRVTGQYSPGADWYSNGKKKVIAYTLNASNVKYFYVEGTQLKCNSTYTLATLYGHKTTDEDGKTVEEFTDKLGRKVLSRVAGDHDTYYVYDDLNNLRYVLPPLAADALGTNTNGFDESANSTLGLYGYIYHYDQRKRCIEKKLPGADWIYMVYDRANRLILTQDGNQRLITQWTVNKYDIFGRLLYSGVIASTNNRSAMESSYSSIVTNESYSGSGPVAGYTNSNFSLASLLIVNYYDNYGFLSYSGNNPGGKLTSIPMDGYTAPASITYAKMLPTGTRVYHLDEPTMYEVTAFYYDKYGRVAQTRASNHRYGYDIAYNAIDFRGKALKTLKEHNISGQPVIPEIYRYVYDNAERLITTRYKLGTNDTITLATNLYDELGRLTSKLRHNNTDTEQYDYNVRNWTTRIKSGAFEENLYYNINSVSSTPCFNGNISYSTWTYGAETKGYKYNYDELNRLYHSYFRDNNYYIDNFYDEYLNFDKQGNIIGIYRATNGSDMDNLDMVYNGNQVKSVYDDAGSSNLYNTKEYNDRASLDTEFQYDQNGNMIKDLDREIVTIQYNLLNLPEIIQFKNGNQIQNTYDASGLKLSTRYFTVYSYTSQPIVAVGNIYDISDMVQLNDEVYIDGDDYIGNVEYGFYTDFYYGMLNESDNWLKQVSNSEGYVDNFYNNIYNYFRRDHLGNNREVWCTNTNATVQRTQYYPSGLPWASNVGDNPGLQERKYNGKEFVEMHGYDTYDYGARGYYPALGRFTSVDPLAEKHYSISPYAYCGGNPVNRIDPDGKDWVMNKKNKQYEWMDNVTANKNTPKGYSYVGSKGTDILKSLGLKSSYSQNQNRKSLSFGNEKSGSSYGNKAGGIAAILLPALKGLTAGEEAKGNVTINVNLSIGKGTDNNKSGLTFNGVSVTGSLSQPDNDLTAKGCGLTVTNGNKVYQSVTLQSPEDGTSNFNPSHTVFTQGTVNIPASNLSPGSLQSANISAGTTNTEVLAIEPVSIDFNLQEK